MSGDRFTIDTNILVYSVDRRSGSKHDMARDVLRIAKTSQCWLTLQSVSEFFTVVSRNGLMPRHDALRVAALWLEAFPIASAAPPNARQAMETASHGLASYWDALLTATAASAGCKFILSEDLADGAVMHDVRIVNPFGPDGLSSSARSVLAV